MFIHLILLYYFSTLFPKLNVFCFLEKKKRGVFSKYWLVKSDCCVVIWCNVSKTSIYATYWFNSLLMFYFSFQLKFDSGVLLLSTHRLIWRDQKNHVSPIFVSCMSFSCKFHNKQVVCNEKPAHGEEISPAFVCVVVQV